MTYKRLIFAALMAAPVLATATIPANAQWWRSCGGDAYEGCDGIRRGPYAGGSYGGYGGYRRPPVRCTIYQTVTRDAYGRIVHVHTHRHCG